MENRETVHLLCDLMDQKLDRPQGTASSSYVTDRPGHDFTCHRRYKKITNDEGWMPSVTLRKVWIKHWIGI
jgi:dTDP-glucose 4,6-dehydratase